MQKMSLSKNIKHCRRCISVTSRRNVQTESSETPTGSVSKMSTRIMSVQQWRILTQLKEFLNKLSNENGASLVINKELANFFQKIQPSIYGKGLIRNFESTNTVSPTTQKVPSDAVPLNEAIKEVKREQQGYSFPEVISSFRLGFGKQSQPENEKPTEVKWKTYKNSVSINSISSRTRHVISSIATAETELSQLKRIEDLSSHLRQFPEAKNLAIKEGAIRLLLRIRDTAVNENTQGAIREAFAILGHIDPPAGHGIRILSIDGGGIRGLLIIEMLRKLEELTGLKVYEMFDYVCGVSTGAILASAIGINKSSLDDVSQNYKEISMKVFSQNAFVGTSSLVWSQAYYDTDMWEQFLKQFLGDTPLIKTSQDSKCPKVALVSAIVNQSRISAYVFRNYSMPYRIQSQYTGSSEYGVWQAVRASAAAPTYFEEFKLDGLLHQDGGILVNNPTAVAIHEAKLLWPNSPIQCVVSFGTGRTHPVHFEPDDSSIKISSSSWKTKFMKILDSATDTEGVHTMLNDLLPTNIYYRFNPYLTDMISMVEIRPEKLEQLERDAIMYLRRNEEKFEQAARSLVEPRKRSQKVNDWVQKKRHILGLKPTV